MLRGLKTRERLLKLLRRGGVRVALACIASYLFVQGWALLDLYAFVKQWYPGWFTSGLFTHWIRRGGGTFRFDLLNVRALFHYVPITLVGILCYVWLTHLVKKWRANMNICIVCEYDLTGNVSGVCPECGTAVRPADSDGYNWRS
jgi:hypothetical protein